MSGKNSKKHINDVMNTSVSEKTSVPNQEEAIQ